MTDLELRRYRDQAMVAGVCAGIASRFGYDVTLVRVVTVLLAFAGGFGVIAYLALWLLLPPGEETSGSATEVARANVEEMAGVARRAAARIGSAARSAARSARTAIRRDGEERDGPAAAAAGAAFPTAPQAPTARPSSRRAPDSAGTSRTSAAERDPREATPRGPVPPEGRTRPSTAPFTPSAVRLPRGGTASPSSGRTFVP